MGLHYSSVVDAPPAEVFAWHERPGALPAPPAAVATDQGRTGGAVAGRRAGRPAAAGTLRWVAQHSGDDPPHRFVDELVSLPLHWRHTHLFEAVDGGATRVIDDVETPVPGSFLRQTFRYRHHQLAGDLAAHRSAAQRGGPLLTIAVTGSSGLIGSALCAYLSTGGHRVIRLVRRAPRDPSERSWDPERPDPRVLEGIDAVVHLAGASIAGRFTDAHKRLVRDSRVGPTSELARVMAAMPDGPRILVCASAIGFYGNAAWRRVAHGGERARRGVPGGSGRSLGGSSTARRRCGRASGACTDGDRPVRPGSEPQAPSPSLLGRPRRTSRSGVAMGVMDRPRRSARCLRAGARRRRDGRPAERGGARCRHQRRVRLDAGSRHATAGAAHGPGVRPRRCSWAPRARAKWSRRVSASLRPASPRRDTSFAILRSRRACGTSWVTSMSRPSERSRGTSETGRRWRSLERVARAPAEASAYCRGGDHRCPCACPRG